MRAVEGGGLVVDRVDDDEAAAGGAGGVGDGGERVDEQLGAEPLAVDTPVERELGEQDRGYPRRRAASDSSRCLLRGEEVRRDREVSADRFGLRVDQEVGARALAVGVAGMSQEPLVQRRLAGVERVEVVVGGERLEAVSHAAAMRLRRLAVLAARARRGASSGSSSEAAS